MDIVLALISLPFWLLAAITLFLGMSPSTTMSRGDVPIVGKAKLYVRIGLVVIGIGSFTIAYALC